MLSFGGKVAILLHVPSMSWVCFTFILNLVEGEVPNSFQSKALIGPCQAQNSCLVSEVTKRQEKVEISLQFGRRGPILLH